MPARGAWAGGANPGPGAILRVSSFIRDLPNCPRLGNTARSQHVLLVLLPPVPCELPPAAHPPLAAGPTAPPPAVASALPPRLYVPLLLLPLGLTCSREDVPPRPLFRPAWPQGGWGSPVALLAQDQCQGLEENRATWTDPVSASSPSFWQTGGGPSEHGAVSLPILANRH